MKVLVTGGAGFIGFHVCERLLQEGHEVYIVDNLKGPSGRECLLKNVSDLQQKGPVVFREIDIRTEFLILDAFSEFKPECIIHLAALAGVRDSLNNPVEYVSVNVIGTEILLKSAVLAGCSRVVNISSSSVYGEGFGTASNEGDVCVPISPYAVTKLAAEHLCRIHTHGGIMTCISLRPFSVYGPRQREGLAILQFLKAVNNGLPITLFGDGSMERDFTYVGDIARCIIKAMTAATTAHDIVNVGAGQPVSLKVLIRAIQEVTGKIAIINRSTLQLGDVAATCAGTVKTKQILQIEEFTPLREGLRSTLDWLLIEPLQSALVKRVA